VLLLQNHVHGVETVGVRGEVAGLSPSDLHLGPTAFTGEDEGIRESGHGKVLEVKESGA
jgi:hypothetical protein